MKRLYWVLFFLLPGFFLFSWGEAQRADTLTLPACFRLATERFPLMAGKPLLQEQVKLKDDNLRTVFFPEMDFQAQASYYSDVVTIEMDPVIPGVTFPQPYHAQYALSVDLHQMIYDGGASRRRRMVEERSYSMKQKDLEVQLYSFKQKLARVFFSTLYLDDNYRILEQNMVQVEKALAEAQTAYEKGVLLAGDVSEVPFPVRLA